MPRLSLPSRPIEGPSAWVRADLKPEDWRVELDTRCCDEIRAVVDDLRAYPLPTIVLDPGIARFRRAARRSRGYGRSWLRGCALRSSTGCRSR
jgi:hypothetical protein